MQRPLASCRPAPASLDDVLLRLADDRVRRCRRSDETLVLDAGTNQITLTVQVDLVGVLDRHRKRNGDEVVQTLGSRERDALSRESLEGIVLGTRLEVLLQRQRNLTLAELHEVCTARRVLQTELRLRIVLDGELERV